MLLLCHSQHNKQAITLILVMETVMEPVTSSKNLFAFQTWKSMYCFPNPTVSLSAPNEHPIMFHPNLLHCSASLLQRRSVL